MRDPARVRAFWHLASDSPPCACPIDLPRVQALGQELFFGDQKGLPLSSRSKIRANGCRGEAPKRLQSGRPVKPELCRPLPLQPFWDSASCSVIYVLLGLPRSTRFACSCRCLGARILRCVGGTKRGAEGEAFWGPPRPRILRTPGAAQEYAKKRGRGGPPKGLSLCTPFGAVNVP